MAKSLALKSFKDLALMHFWSNILFSLHHQVLRVYFSFTLSSVRKGEDVYIPWFSILLLNQLFRTSVSKCSKRGIDWHFCQRTIFCSVVFSRVNGKSSTTNLFNSPLGNYKPAAKTAKVVPKCSIFKLHKSKNLKIFTKWAFLFLRKRETWEAIFRVMLK